MRLQQKCHDVRRATPRIGITLGDPAGIGPEVTLRALQHPATHCLGAFTCFGDPQSLDRARRGIRMSQKLWRQLPVTSVDDRRYRGRPIPVGKPSERSGQAAWVALDAATRALRRGQIDLLVTAPVGKSVIHGAGHWFPGHTEWLARRAGLTAGEVGMMLLGGGLRVMLVTRHIPIRRIVSQITVTRIRATLDLCVDGLRDALDITHPRIAVAALNPHAGEQGRTGTEEREIIAPAIRGYRRRGARIVGPVSPDAVFYDARAGLYDAVVTMYHDQGLIPLKMLSRDTGVNLTIGLPFIRTSPDHGTAYGIATRYQAHPGAMQAAIALAAQIWHRTA